MTHLTKLIYLSRPYLKGKIYIYILRSKYRNLIADSGLYYSLIDKLHMISIFFFWVQAHD